MQKLIKSKLLSAFPEIHHGTSTKAFGPLSFSHDRDTNEVIIDRVKFLDALSLPANHSVFLCEQNHTDNIKIVCENDECKGVFDQLSRIPNSDSMITDKQFINLVIYTADCMPILIYDPVKKIIAAVHSGWKGTIKHVAVKTLEKMIKKFGSKKEDIIVYIGPSIGSCCYAVKNEDQIKEFKKCKNGSYEKDHKVFVNLWNYIEEDLLNFGIKKENLEISGLCTVCNNDLFASHYLEKEKQTTDNLTVIALI